MFNSRRKDFVLVSTLDILFIHFCMCTRVYACVWRWNDNMWESVLSLYHGGFGNRLRSSHIPTTIPTLLAKYFNSTHIRQIPCTINKCKISQVMACKKFKTGHWREGLVECSCRKSQFSSKTHVGGWQPSVTPAPEDLTSLLASVGICMYVHISTHK